MPDYLGLSLQLQRNALSQYANYNFNSMCEFNGEYLGANGSGIFKLDSGDLDGTAIIDAFFELLTSDWGVEHQKRIRSIYVGYETDGKLMVTYKDDDDNERHFILEPNHVGNKQHSSKVPGDRRSKGRYWMIRIDNINGSDFSVDDIKVLPVILNRKPSMA